ncbi:MAG: hypothetical protein ACLQIB_33185 [Isosphaeraceae bacterium]
MDGRTRPSAVIALLFVVVSSSLSGLGNAEGAYKSLPDNAPLYISPRLDREFLGAVSIDLRVDDKVTPRRAELGLMQLVSQKGATPTRYKTKLIPILLEKVAGNSDSYVISRMPADLIKPDEALTITLTTASGDGDSAHLTLCGSDGKPCRDIKLNPVNLPKEPVKLESEQEDHPR